MGYSKQEKLDIGKQIYDGVITQYQAAEEYHICQSTARNYMRLYRGMNQLPAKRRQKSSYAVSQTPACPKGLEDLETMTKEELILELVKARVAEARLKKGYEVKGDGSVIRYVSRNIK